MLTREPAQQLPDPHPASAAVELGDTTYCSSVLPWRSCGKHADKTATAIIAMLERRRLQVPTSALPHQIDGLLTIDRVAVDRDARVAGAARFSAAGLSDHDGYVIELVSTARYPSA